MNDSHTRPRLAELTDAKLASYSLPRALDALIAADGDPRAFERAAPIEAAQSRVVADSLEREPSELGFFLPLAGRRDLTVATTTAGGYLVGSTIPSDAFIGGLYAASVVLAAGVPRVDGLSGNVLLPRVPTTPAITWLANEGATVTDSAPAFGQLAATPKSVGAYLPVSRQFLLQISPGANAFLLGELGAALGAAVDAAVIAGSGGGGQPTGVLNVSGVGTQAGSALAWSGIAAMVKTVASANGLRTPSAAAWVASPDVEEVLTTRERASGSGFIWDRGQIGGRSAFASNSVPAATLIFGDWSSIALLSWGALEIRVDPYTSFKSGIVGVRAIMDVDVAVRYAASFCISSSIT